MQDANAELVRRFYGALNANDLAGLRSLCQNIEFVNPESAAEPGTRVGEDAFRAAFEGLHANFEAFRCEPERITPFRHSLVGPPPGDDHARMGSGWAALHARVRTAAEAGADE